MSDFPYFSIAIATYNRPNKVLQTINEISKCSCTDIEVVVTCDCSSEEIVRTIASSTFNRLRIFNNNTNLGSFCNMIQSIFNCRGQYALYCNDGDEIANDKLGKIINLLRGTNYSFVQIDSSNNDDFPKIERYSKGFDSLIHRPVFSHPTGMVFNVPLLKQ